MNPLRNWIKLSKQQRHAYVEQYMCADIKLTFGQMLTLIN